jgi:small subunit ribosomal protein S4
MRDLRPKLKSVRRFGEEFALAADRGLADKFRKLKRKQPPGQHGAKKAYKKVSAYGVQLSEKQKLKFFYHISERQLRNYYVKASSRRGSTSDNLMQLLETRLDNLIYRAGYADSHRQARQLAAHGHFSLNGKKVDLPSIDLKPGDKVALFSKSVALKELFTGMLAKNAPADWIKINKDELSAEVLSLPKREQIDTPVNEQLVIEFYSR